MIYIVCALYFEAEYFIKKLELERNRDFDKFDIYSSDKYFLIITGSGKINSAAALAYALSSRKINKNDILINFGICGSLNKNLKLGDCFFINKIMDYDSGYIYYPETIFKTYKSEQRLLTVSQKIFEHDSNCLIDMEASAVYSVGSKFFKSYQIMFFKILSDYSDVDILDKAQISKFIQKESEFIIEFTEKIHNELSKRRNILSAADEILLDSIGRNLCLSKTNCLYLFKCAEFYKASAGNLGILIPYSENIVNDKNTGKVLLNEIKNKLLQ